MTSSSENQRARWYALKAIGDLQTETKEVPRLRSILFIASNASENHTWMTPNRGSFVRDFSFLVDAGTAHTLYQKICQGETVTFPGLFDLAVLKERLGG